MEASERQILGCWWVGPRADLGGRGGISSTPGNAALGSAQGPGGEDADARVAAARAGCSSRVARICRQLLSELQRTGSVANRVVESEHGSLILPQYQTVQSFFGTALRGWAAMLPRHRELYKPQPGGPLDLVAPAAVCGLWSLMRTVTPSQL